MVNSLRQTYKVETNNIEKSYAYQLGLKNNKEYENRVDASFLALVNVFHEMYPEVKIGAPRGREKSEKSLQDKIKKLEIERLCKLYAIEGISPKEQKTLCELVQENMKKEKQRLVEKLFFAPLENLEDLETCMQDEEIMDTMKTALLRVTKTRLQRENVQNKEPLLEKIEKNYGQTAVKITGQQKDNLLHWECIENLEEETKNKLHNPFEYLRVKDLRGIKIVVTEVPDSIQTNNEELKELIEKRKRASKQEKVKYDDLCCIALSKDFVNQLMQKEELLERLNIQFLPEGYKHKEKQNGYIAEHVKFCYRDHPEYTFELQLRSMYREDLSRANGKAAHDKRAGKRRVFPSMENKQNFIEKMRFMLPKYTLLKRDNGKNSFSIYKCKMLENALEYYLGYITISDEEYEKAIQYIEEEESR